MYMDGIEQALVVQNIGKGKVSNNNLSKFGSK